LHRPLTSRKGASEVIAAMLLIVITVAASILMYTYASGLMGQLQGVKLQQQYLEHLTLEYYDWTVTGPSGTLKLIIRNVGSAVINIGAGSWYINGVKQTESGCTGTLAPQTGACTATITPTGSILPIQKGVAYAIKVVTQDGSLSSYSCIAGQFGSPVG
jgi:flagellin-like protein